MDTLGTKRQAISEGTMATTENTYFLNELQARRERLAQASHEAGSDTALRELLHSVDEALGRLENGTFGICEECHDSTTWCWRRKFSGRFCRERIGRRMDGTRDITINRREW